jgi:hypothetical protein
MAHKPTPTPTYPQYTNLPMHDGLFDQLMAAVKHHLDIEFDAQRIRGDTYSRTYLGAMEAVLGNTTQYLLGIMLITEQREKLKNEADLIALQKEELQFRIDKIYPLELLKTEAEVELVEAQVIKIQKEIEFLDAKIATETANVDATGVLDNSVIGRQMALLRAQKLGFAGDLEAKVAKLHADYAAVFQSVMEISTASTLNDHSITAIQFALETAQSIKDPDYIDPELPDEPFPQPELPDSPPNAPTDLTATPVLSTQVDLAWVDNSVVETSFDIERGPVGGPHVFLIGVPANSVSYIDGTVSPATSYEYRVRARNASGTSDYTNIASVTTPA